jgi:hypothetical protein
VGEGGEAMDGVLAQGAGLLASPRLCGRAWHRLTMITVGCDSVRGGLLTS